VQLDSRTETQGDILCEQVRIIDLQERSFDFVETVPSDILQKTYNVINALIKPVL